jgi:hypothetical protein
VVWNKADVSAPGAKFPGLAISAKTGAGVEALVARIVEALGAGEAGGEALLASVRQRELIERAAARLHARAPSPVAVAASSWSPSSCARRPTRWPRSSAKRPPTGARRDFFTVLCGK